MSPVKSKPSNVQRYRIYIRATPKQAWSALTEGRYASKYGYYAPVKVELRKGGKFQSLANEGMKEFPGIPDVIGDGEVLECRAPRRLVHTWRMLMTPELAEEGFTRVTYEIDPGHDGVTRLTVTHELGAAAQFGAVMAGQAEDHGAGGGWAEVLSGMKTLLETRRPLPPQSGRS